MIFNFKYFCLNEARKDKKFLIDTLDDLLTKKVSVEMKNGLSQKDIYSTSAIIQYFKDQGLTSQNATDALNAFQNDKDLKKDLKSITIRDAKLKANYPYFYKKLSDAEANKIKEKIEKSSKEMPEVKKSTEAKKSTSAKTTKRNTTKK
jgi:hypothetical protein